MCSGSVLSYLHLLFQNKHTYSCTMVINTKPIEQLEAMANNVIPDRSPQHLPLDAPHGLSAASKKEEIIFAPFDPTLRSGSDATRNARQPCACSCGRDCRIIS
jgi:hypothetical protein